LLTVTFAAVTFIGFEKVLTFIGMLSVLVVLHELGHFIVARRAGVKINEFAIFMGPKIVGWRSPRTGTLYSLRAIPIGGYCAMEGEDNKSSEAEQQRGFLQLETSGAVTPAMESANFQAKTPWQRLAIVLAGPFANFLLCYLILLAGALAFGIQSDRAQPVVGTLVAGSPAQKAGIRAGDRIVELNGKAILSGKQLIDTIHSSLGKPLDLVYKRDGAQTEVRVTPASCARAGMEKMGCIGFTPVMAYARVSPGEAFRDSGEEFVNIADQTVGGIVLLVTQFGKYANQVAGPVGMGQIATTVQDFGWGPYFVFAALISFALGLFNLLPVPALDGGRAAFIVAELIRGKPVDPEKEAMVHIAGFAALMAFILIVTFHDIARIVSGNGVM
jgi:regulator of sigma E protease